MARDAQRKQLHSEDPDLALVKAMARNDTHALEELYQRRGPRILSYLTGRLRDPGLAEEVLQDVMLSAWQSASRFRGESRVYTWLLAIARNRSINAFRRQQSANPIGVSIDDSHLDCSGEFPSEIEQESAYDRVRMALRALPDEQHETLELVFFHGLSLEETARVQKISIGTVKSRLHRAKERLRTIVKSEDESNA